MKFFVVGFGQDKGLRILASAVNLVYFRDPLNLGEYETLLPDVYNMAWKQIFD